MRRLSLCGGFLLLALAGIALPGCSGSDDKGPTILCTTTLVADVVREVAGGHQSVGVLMGAGVDPHLFDPTPQDARRLSQARVIFYSGLHLEGKMTELLEDLGRKKPAVAITKSIPEDKLRKDENGKHDPHVWFDAALWAQTAEVVADTLAAFDPAHADEYRANARNYRDRLLALHQEVKQEMKKIPENQRALVTAHDAFEYFGDAYGIQVKAVQGVSTESEAGLKEIRGLVGFLTERRIKAIFFETSVSDKNVRALQEGCEKAGHNVKIGGELYSDSLDAENKPAGNYEGMMRHNVRTIVDALK